MEKNKDYQYDIFLGGQWVKYALQDYKMILMKRFPHLSFYNPEENQDGNWFVSNLTALHSSRILFCYVPPFPMSGVSLEVGYFYGINKYKHLLMPFDNIVIMWDPIHQPKYGITTCQKMGHVFHTWIDCFDHISKLITNER